MVATKINIYMLVHAIIALSLTIIVINVRKMHIGYGVLIRNKNPFLQTIVINACLHVHIRIIEVVLSIFNAMGSHINKFGYCNKFGYLVIYLLLLFNIIGT